MKKISDLAINSNGFAFEPTQGESFLFNESGNKLLVWLRDGHSIEEAASLLSVAYSISYGDSLSDVLDFSAKLRILGFEVK